MKPLFNAWIKLNMSKLGDFTFVTKLAGFEHTNYIQGNCLHEKISDDYIPLFIGKTVKNGRIDTSFDWYVPKSLSDKLPRSKLNKKCIVLPYVGSVGDLAIFDGSYEAHLGSNIAKIELNDECPFSEEFIYYFLKSPYGQSILLKDIQGAVQQNITMDAIRNVDIPSFSTDEQEDIVRILKAIDDKIDKNTSLIQELYKTCEDLFDYWFLQYNFPDSDNKPYRANKGEMIKDSTSGRTIPAGWSIVYLKDLVSKEKNAIVDGPFGTQMKINEYTSEGVPVYEMEQLNNLFIVTRPKHFISEDKFETIKRSMVKNGDIIISKTGTLGLLGVVRNEQYNKGIIVSRLAKITPDEKKLGKYYLLILLNKLTKSGYWMAKSGGSTMPILNNTLLENVQIELPNNDLLLKFELIVTPLFEQIYRSQKSIVEMEKLMNQLLPALISRQARFLKKDI